MDLDALLRPSLRGRRPPSYPAGPRDLLRMDGNTNLYGRNPALDRAAAALASVEVQHYPSGLQEGLRDALAARHGLSPAEVLVGAGSDELIDLVLRTFVEPGVPVAWPVPTFVMYSFYARLAAARGYEVPLGEGFALDVEGLLQARAAVTFVASPNNPTGNRFEEGGLLRLVRESGGLVVIDEAYAEYGEQDFVRRVRSFPNLAVLRTFSKVHGMAGLRVGALFASAELVSRLILAKTPFTVGLFSETAARMALEETEFVRASRAMVEAGKRLLPTLLAPLECLPTDANFILVKVGPRAGDLARHLLARGILVRDMEGFPGLSGHLRITIGRPEHHERLAAAVREFRP